ncbi:MAG: MATE family efflux transporter, partial [Bacilli bacterium]
MKKHGLDRKFIRTFFVIAAPAMVQQIITFGVSLLDTLMIGGISNDAVSAVYAVNQITFLFFLAISGLVAGAGIYIQQFFGSKDKEHLIQSFRHKILAVTLGLVVMSTLIILFGNHLLRFYVREETNPESIMTLANQYLPYIMISFIPYSFTAVYATSMREIGKTVYPTIASAVAFIVNGVANYLLIYVARCTYPNRLDQILLNWLPLYHVFINTSLALYLSGLSFKQVTILS